METMESERKVPVCGTNADKRSGGGGVGGGGLSLLRAAK